MHASPNVHRMHAARLHTARKHASRMLSLAVATLVGGIVATPAFAQDNSTASGKHFSIVGGVAHQEPTGDGKLDGKDIDFDGSGSTTLSASYYINDNIAIEGWGALDGFSHRVVRQGDGKVATVDVQPYALSGQYHFGEADNTVRPFAGLGYYQSNINNETSEGSDRYSGQHIGVTTPKGAMATAGVDLNFTPKVFARVDARYMDGGSDIAVDGVKSGEANLDPLVIGLGVGARF